MSFFGIPMRNGLSLGLGTVASLTNGPGFLPDELFYGGTVQGAWYDPSDLTTLFQDSAGTTPVTAVEQAVGLMLDKSKGLVLGPELVTNGDFSGGTGWTAEAGITIGSGVASFATTSNQVLYQTVSVTAARFYRVTLTLVSYSSGTPGVSIGAGTIVDIPNTSVLGAKTMYVVAGSADSLLRIRGGTFGVGGTCSIDNISVRELPGNHAYQSTSASRPTLRARYNLLTRSEEFGDAVWAKTFISVTSDAAIAPNGTLTADRVVETAVTNLHFVQQAVPLTAGTTYRIAVFAKAQQRTILQIATQIGTWGTNFFANFDLTNGTAHNQTAASATIQSFGNGWYLCAITATSAGTGALNTISFGPVLSTSSAVFPSYAGDASSGLLLWGAQFTATAVFPSNTYQRIGAATDYATGAAFPPYLFFDGTDDSMLTNSVDFATVTSDGQARRNLLLNPTQFDTAVWNKGTGGSISANTVVAPDGTLTADAYTWATSTASFAYLDQTVSGNATVTHTYSIWLKRPVGSGSRNLKLVITDFTLTTGVSADFTVTETWQRFTFSRTSANNTGFVGAGITLASSGSIAAGEVLDAWGAQLETGSTATAFQNIGTDKMLVVAGVTKQSDAGTAILLELTAAATANAFYITAPTDPTTVKYRFASVGSGLPGVADATAASFAAPTTNVLTGIGNIAAPVATLRINGAQVASTTSSQGAGNYQNAPLYIGRRNNASLPFNGNLYSLVIAGQSYSSGQISSTESWVAAKTPLGTI